jgi:hypothetical protein
LCHGGVDDFCGCGTFREDKCTMSYAEYLICESNKGFNEKGKIGDEFQNNLSG